MHSTLCASSLTLVYLLRQGKATDSGGACRWGSDSSSYSMTRKWKHSAICYYTIFPAYNLWLTFVLAPIEGG